MSEFFNDSRRLPKYQKISEKLGITMAENSHTVFRKIKLCVVPWCLVKSDTLTLMKISVFKNWGDFVMLTSHEFSDILILLDSRSPGTKTSRIFLRITSYFFRIFLEKVGKPPWKSQHIGPQSKSIQSLGKVFQTVSAYFSWTIIYSLWIQEFA